MDIIVMGGGTNQMLLFAGCISGRKCDYDSDWLLLPSCFCREYIRGTLIYKQ